MDWFRWWHGTTTDPKLGRIAHEVQCGRGDVVAIWAAILEHASTSSPRGDVSGLDAADIAFALDLDDQVVASVIGRMAARRMIVDGQLAAWSERQPGDRTAAERKRRQREREREYVTRDNRDGVTTGISQSYPQVMEAGIGPVGNQQKQDVEPILGDVTRDVTVCHTEERRREEKEQTKDQSSSYWNTPTSGAGVTAGAAALNEKVGPEPAHHNGFESIETLREEDSSAATALPGSTTKPLPANDLHPIATACHGDADAATAPRGSEVPQAENAAAMRPAATRIGGICKRLRELGINAAPSQFSHPDWVSMLAQVGDDDVIAAAEYVRDREPSKRFTAAYLLPVLQDAIEEEKKQPRKPSGEGAWWATEAGINAMAKKLGMRALGGESWPEFTARIKREIARRERETT